MPGERSHHRPLIGRVPLKYVDDPVLRPSQRPLRQHFDSKNHPGGVVRVLAILDSPVMFAKDRNQSST